VAKEINSLCLEAERMVEFSHFHYVEILAIPGGRIITVDAIEVHVEVAALFLLEKTHQV